MKDLYIIGAGGFGREVADSVRAINAHEPKYRIAGFIDDDASLWGSVKNDVPVLGGREYLKTLPAAPATRAVIAIADARNKEGIAADLQAFVTWVNIVHPTAVVSAYSEMGCGNVVQAHAFVSANTRIGDHCMINTKSGLGHDAELRDYVSVMSFCDVTGHVRLERGVYLGTSVAIIPDVKIGEYAYICGGSVIFKDVKANAVMIGNPAKQVK
ncbi:MAG: NeuD/PglB/VioB family sugar acetyltransferase [Clostridiales Family XIII bacterium]|jgi:sugar O-acyltransferase (sialic acid O-acetyltransferase NeuD family)|nr:NeuD/PglB/VioB family sugar acetyltransferase [Clostridiales Family XIII bacterium]